MPYTITLTDGTTLTTVADSTVDNTTSLTLVGRNYSGYGGYVAENFVHQLENFSDTSAPSAPLVGQLWFNSAGLALNVWNGEVWTPLLGASNIQNSLITGPPNAGYWSIYVSDTSPYVGMLVFQFQPCSSINPNVPSGSPVVVMALDGVNNLIHGAVTYS